MKYSEEIDKRREINLLIKGESAKIGFDLFRYRKSDTKVEKRYMVSYPNFTALYLSISDKHYDISTDLFDNKIESMAVDMGDYYEARDEDEKYIYDFIESTFIAIVFAHASVETLVNSLIPNNIVIIKKPNQESYQGKFKNFVERHVKLEEKIKKILPKVYSYGFNARDIKCWSGFKRLMDLRNELLHFKSHSFDKGKDKQSRAVAKLFYHVVRDDVIKSARLLIKYLYTKMPGVPGFPIEFQDKEIAYDKFYSHYENQDFSKMKRLIVEFPDNKSLEDFILQKESDETRVFRFYVEEAVENREN